MQKYSTKDKIGLAVIAILTLWLAICTLWGERQITTQSLILEMQAICEKSYTVLDGDLEQKCGEKIDAVQSRGYEVLSKNGQFWAERK